jgi:F-type H+-transporting ATPase subunit a
MQMFLLASGDPIGHVVQYVPHGCQVGEGFWSFPFFSNVILMQVIGAAILVWGIPKAVQLRAASDGIGRLVPRGWGTAIETVCVELRDKIFRPNLGKYTDMFTPYLWSLFFFILIANVLGLFPLSDWLTAISPTLGHVVGGASTANFYVNGALAAITLTLMVYNGLRFHGIHYVKHFFIGPWWICWLIAIIEIAGLLFKAGALCIRLTANMLAGHILLAVLLGFINSAGGLGSGTGFLVAIPVVGASVLVYFLEVLVAFLHAFIFTMLTAVFIGMAVNIHHEDEHEHEHEEHAAGAVAAAH